MLLYSIRRKSDGRYFVHTDGRGRAQWNTTPTFWRTPDSIWKNLGRLCGEFYMEPYQVGKWDVSEQWTYYRKNWRDIDAKKLKKYEVITHKVKIMGKTRTPAEDFVVVKKLKKMNLIIK